MEILEETEHIVYYRENGKLAGFAGYSKNNSKKYLLRKKFYSILKNILYKSRKIKDVNALKEYFNNYNYVPKNIENHFEGEVSILIIDEKYRGKGIGKKLLQEVFELAKNDNMKNLQILTDEACNYMIYEKLGCKKIYETLVKNQETQKCGNKLSHMAYIYEKELY